MDYIGHFYSQQDAPPNVNGTCAALGIPIGHSGATGLPDGGLACPQSSYSNLQPAWVSFDLSLGYDTGEDPANDYLKNIGVQVIIQNILDKHSPFQYKPTNAGGPVSISNPVISDYGRQVSLILTKTW
jgi:hypothetical protein